MIVKFFKGDHSAVTNGLKYLEGDTKRRKEKPVLLSGNSDITREWLKRASHFSKSFTYGCLSFEESDIPVHQKQQLMASFEQTLLTGLTAEQYDIVWIEHRDKRRLELNFHIVNMELTTGRSFTPYVHSRDMVRIDAWKCIANDTYGFSDPNDPSKTRTFAWGDNSKTRRELMTQIDDYLFDLAVAGSLNNQQDVIDVLNEIEGITVTRNTKSSISFTADGHQKPIRLKGELYGKSYTGIENSAAKQAERTASFARQRHERIKENKQQLQQRNRHLAHQRRKIYQSTFRKTTTPKLSISTANGSSVTTGRDGIRPIYDIGIWNSPVSALPSNFDASRQVGTVILSNNALTEKDNKKTIKEYANDHTYQPKNPSTWVFEVISKLRETIKVLAGSINGRKNEAKKFSDIYHSTQCQCDNLNQLLKTKRIWGLVLEQRKFCHRKRDALAPIPIISTNNRYR